MQDRMQQNLMTAVSETYKAEIRKVIDRVVEDAKEEFESELRHALFKCSDLLLKHTFSIDRMGSDLQIIIKDARSIDPEKFKS